jgi:hypothetical protein
MKTQKLIVIAAIVCLLVGASGAAMAGMGPDPKPPEEPTIDNNTCSEGTIEGAVDGDIVIENRSCLIDDADVKGNITVANAETITIIGTKVSGTVWVTQSRQVTIAGNDLEDNLTIVHNETATVAANRAGGTTIDVNENGLATVKRNISKNLYCLENTRLSALGNETTGAEDCR